VPIVSKGFVNQSQIASAVKRAARALAPDVVRIRYSLDGDWTGEPSVFFRVVLSDEASAETDLSGVAQRIALKILNEVKAEELGLNPYFNYRSFSEQAELQEAAWE